MRDPLRDEILRALDTDDLSGDFFEACMCDLLRDVFPGLVPVRGGSDGGIDGEVCTQGEPPFPLIATTSRDVRRNLKQSISAYRRIGGTQCRAVLATSRAITPQGREKLRKQAKELGFELDMIIDRSGVADRLYRDAAWRRKLLGISGRPAALSEIPPRPRFAFRDIELIGREDDLDWLLQTEGDLVLAGQPGSGKTHLLEALVRRGQALFLTSTDEEHLADGLRKLSTNTKPMPRIIVDDAEPRCTQLAVLMHLRQRFDWSFSIIASCWEHHRDPIAHEMDGLPRSQVRRLELLTRQQICEIIEKVGVRGPDTLLRELVNQSSLRPGLAVTLASLCKTGDWRRVVLGDALATAVLPDLERRLGDESTHLLAMLALGGDAGLTIETAIRYSEISERACHDLARGIAAGGVLRQTGPFPKADPESRQPTYIYGLSVWPRTLRCALVRDRFFSPSLPAANLGYRPILEDAIVRDHAVETVLGALLRGGKLATEEIQALSRGSSSLNVWQLYAMLRPETAIQDLEHDLEQQGRSYPKPVQIAPQVLENAPSTGVRWLLRQAETASGPLHSNPGHPMRVLNDWLAAIHDDDLEETLRRRRLTVDLAHAHLQRGGDPHVAAHAVLLALSPGLEGTSPDPADLKGMRWRWGLIPGSFIPEIRRIWHAGRTAVTVLAPPTWEHLSTCLWAWIHPGTVSSSRPVPEQTARQMRAFAVEVLQDLSLLVRDSVGLAAGLRRLAARCDATLELEADPVFEALFPDDPKDPEPSAWVDEARALALTLATEDPVATVRRLGTYLEAAAQINCTDMRRPAALFEHLAAAVSEPGTWLEEMMTQGSAAQLVLPFLSEVARSRCPSWATLVQQALECDDLAKAAVLSLLDQEDLPLSLLSLILERTALCPGIVEQQCWTGRVPVGTLHRLLVHDSSEVALAAAIGTWYADPRGEIGAELRPHWERAVLRFGERDEHTARDDHEHGHWMGDVISHLPDLALRWLELRITTATIPMLFTAHSAYRKALAALRPEDRSQLLAGLQPGTAADRVVPGLIDRDLSLFQKLLARQDLRKHHLRPLAGEVDEHWKQMALMAQDAGHSALAIAAAALDDTMKPWNLDEEQEHWARQITSFENLEASGSWQLREIARAGLELAHRLLRRNQAVLKGLDDQWE